MTTNQFKKAQEVLSIAKRTDDFYHHLIERISAEKKNIPYDDPSSCRHACEFVINYIEAERKQAAERTDNAFEKI